MQQSLFDQPEQSVKKLEKEFAPKDVFFNNGIVNLCRFLEESSLDVQMNLTDARLMLIIDAQK